LEYEKFVEVAKDARHLGAKIVCLSGGEPFLHPRIVDMIVFANSIGLETYVYTSGIIFNEKNERCPLDDGVLKAISGVVSKIIFNIEASKSDTYDTIMGTKDCFEIMKKSVVSAVDFSIKTEAHFVPMKVNKDEIETTIELCKELGISKLSFLRLVLHGRAHNNAQKIVLSDSDNKSLKILLETLEKNAQEKNAQMSIRVGVPLSTGVSCHKCEVANGKLNIKYDGKVFPCEVFKNDHITPKLNGLQPDSIYNCSLENIYHNSQYLCLVREKLKSFDCEKHCETCFGQYLMNIQ
jgi:MoaA/NifB/PqqE/SkfB family radical SAM enzyme